MKKEHLLHYDVHVLCCRDYHVYPCLFSVHPQVQTLTMTQTLYMVSKGNIESDLLSLIQYLPHACALKRENVECMNRIKGVSASTEIRWANKIGMLEG